MIVLNDLLKYSNLKIYQETEAFNFSLDSVLLPNFVTLNKNVKKILDIGTGNAPIPLILSKFTDAQIIGVEIQSSIATLAIKTVKYNNLDQQIKIVNEDIKEFAQKEKAETYDLITCNPPYFEIKNSKNLSEKESKLIARHEVKLNLEDIFKIAHHLLKFKGSLAIVHRPSRLSEIINLCNKYNIKVKRLQFVYPKKEKEANIVLIEAVKGGLEGLKVLPPLITYEGNDYTNQIKKYFEERK